MFVKNTWALGVWIRPGSGSPVLPCHIRVASIYRQFVIFLVYHHHHHHHCSSAVCSDAAARLVLQLPRYSPVSAAIRGTLHWLSFPLHLQVVSHDTQVSPRTGADMAALLCAAGFCSLLLSTTFNNTYVYSRATVNLGLWAGVLERPSSQAPRPCFLLIDLLIVMRAIVTVSVKFFVLKFLLLLLLFLLSRIPRDLGKKLIQKRKL